MRLASSAGRVGSRVWHHSVEFLLPRSCVSCDEPLVADEPGLVCGICWSRLSFLPHPQCLRCGHPTGGRDCRWCDTLPPFVRSARSVCWVPHSVGSGIVHALKYNDWTSVSREMANRIARLSWPEDVERERAALVPVPLAAVRERERGFNQAHLMALEIAKCWRVPVWSDVIARGVATGTQTRLTPAERLANVRRAFGVPAAARRRVHGLHLVLVDDVITTGATLNACAAALFEAGARTLSYVTFGRARASGDR